MPDPRHTPTDVTLTRDERQALGTRLAGVMDGAVDEVAAEIAPAVERIVADRLAAERERVWTEAYEQGVADERTSTETTNGEFSPNRVNPYRAARIARGTA